MDICPNALFNKLVEDLSRFEEFDKLPLPSPDATYHEVAADALRRSLLKKYVSRIDKKADARALEKFLETDLRCSQWREAPGDTRDEILLGEFRRAVYDFWYEKQITPLVTHAFDVLDHARMGPGSSYLVQETNLYSKLFSSTLSVSNPQLYVTYKAYISDSETWYNAEVRRIEEFGVFKYAPSSKLGFVPKNDQISRTICTEPSLNMFFQLGLGQIISRRLTKIFGIDLSRQPRKNRELARHASLKDDMATIDLSSASDSISLGMVRATFPPSFVRWLELLRSRTMILPGREEPHELSVVSTMGNGFTFPLETMIFSCVVLSAFRFHGLRPCNPYGNALGNWACFGDDIIVPREIADTTVRLLGLLGFQVNTEKSFFQGPFRESCGGDFYKGSPVRGVYIKSLKTPADLNQAVNLLNLWTARTGIALPRTVRYLLKRMHVHPVPVDSPIAAGVRMPLEWALGSKLLSWNRNGSVRYRGLFPSQKRLQVGRPRPGNRRQIIENPDGLLICILAGVVTQGEYIITRVNGQVQYSTKQRVCPNWDALATWPRIPDNENTEVTDFARFKWAYEVNKL